MDERSEESRADRLRGRDPSSIRGLFDRAAPLDSDARERLLDTCSAAQEVVDEVRALLALTPDHDRSDPWANDVRRGRVLVGAQGRWRLDTVVGEGGAGRVYRAVDLDRGGFAAIKIIDAGRGTPERLARVADELRALESMEHPGIVRVLDADLDAHAEESREPWIAMEFIDGARTITEHALDLPATDRSIEPILDLLERALEIVAAVHESGVVHRDLKPSNLLVDASGRVRLIDFGVARLLGAHAEGPTLSIDRTREGDLVGTPAYMAPEQVDATLGPISTATDVHALGVLAYRLLTGRLPYAIGESLLSAAQAIRFVPPRDLRILAPEVGDPVATVVERCLAKIPSERPENAGVALDMLRAARRHGDRLDSSNTGHETGAGRGLRVAVVAVAVVAITVAAIVAATALRSGDIDNPTDPTFNQAVRQETGAGDSEMKLRPFLGAVMSTAMMTGSVCAQDAVQWRVEDGGNGHWYRVVLFAEPTSWTEASEACSASGGSLVIIEEPGENNFISSIIDNSWCWVGGLQESGAREPAGGWHWVDGTVIQADFWAPGQPDNYLGDQDRLRRRNSSGLDDVPDGADLGTVAGHIIEWSADCNSDGIVDYGQILDGTFTDSDGNGVPDCCDSGTPCDSEAVQWRVEDGGNGHWYLAIPDDASLSWEDSRSLAIQKGGDLISVSSEAEWIFLTQQLLADFPVGSYPDELGAYLPLGLFQTDGAREPAGGWNWIDPSSFDVPWRYNEPNNSPGAGCNERWGQIHRDPVNGFFVNDYCNVALPQWFGMEWSADCNGDGIVDYGQILDGTLADADLNGVPDECENLVCIGDITGNGRVDAADLGILLAVWNTAGKSNPEADINGDGNVDAADLGLLLGNWGPCPE